jgi:hypothetical protein
MAWLNLIIYHYFVPYPLPHELLNFQISSSQHPLLSKPPLFIYYCLTPGLGVLFTAYSEIPWTSLMGSSSRSLPNCLSFIEEYERYRSN